MQAGMKRPSPEMVVAVIALIAALGGTAWAALGKNTVGPRQLKAQAVTTAKIANGAVTGAKIGDGSLTGQNFNLSALGTVPNAQSATAAQNAATVGGRAASCPSGTTLVRGICFDSSPSGPVTGVAAAADACVQRGGWLPTPEELFSARGVLNLGDGIGSHSQFTDSYVADTSGSHYSTTVVNSTGETFVLDKDPITKAIVATYEYTCAYPLVR